MVFTESWGYGTFDDTATNLFIPYVKEKLGMCTRVDVYLSHIYSIKESTREQQGKGKWQEVSNCVDFLHESKNKKQSFSFSKNWHQWNAYIGGKYIVTTGVSVAFTNTICKHATMKK